MLLQEEVNLQHTISVCKFSGTDLLPVSPEIESQVIQEVLTQVSNGRISQQELAAKHENENA